MVELFCLNSSPEKLLMLPELDQQIHNMTFLKESALVMRRKILALIG